ncbi:MAG: FkbM family methyltransferase [Acidobacteriota bacterium]
MKLLKKIVQGFDFISETRSLHFLKDVVLKRGTSYRVNVRSKNLVFDLNPGAGDWFTVLECCIRGDYTNPPIALHSGDVVVDIGGNFGAAACMFSLAVGANGKVFCYEPFPSSYDRIVRHLSQNKCGNVTAFCTAIGGSTRMTEITTFEKSAYNSIQASVDGRSNNETSSLMVKVTDVRDIINPLESIDLMKIDCEGSEYEIFERLHNADLKKIRQFSIELHKVPGRSFEDIIEKLKAVGFSISGRNPVTAIRYET